MSVLLYGITEAHAPEPAGAGLRDRPLRTVSHDNLRAVVSDLDNDPPVDEASLWAYERVVERLMAETTVLPARFGTTAKADEEIAAMLAERRAELGQTLERVREAVEFAVHPPTSPQIRDDADGSGTAYMERLLTEDRHLRELDSTAGRMVRARRRIAHGHAYLVARGDTDEFLASARELGLSVTGPWPPYSFTTAS